MAVLRLVLEQDLETNCFGSRESRGQSTPAIAVWSGVPGAEESKNEAVSARWNCAVPTTILGKPLRAAEFLRRFPPRVPVSFPLP
jgi:hypothetical protein